MGVNDITPNFRSRKFSIVVHNVLEKDKQYWTSLANTFNFEDTAVSIEPYIHQQGHHLHIFLFIRTDGLSEIS